jgi:predicted RNase H-like nuclease (RuvC/YqgF family)
MAHASVLNSTHACQPLGPCSQTHMSSPTERQLATAEGQARHLATDADEQLRLLHLLRNELPLKRTVERGASDVGHERLEANARTNDTLQRLVREDRHVLDELRATLVDLRNSLRASGQVPERRSAPRDPGKPDA